MTSMHFPWISLSVLTPLVMAAWARQARSAETSRWICLAACSAAAVFSTGAWIDYALLDAATVGDPWPWLYQLLGSEVFILDALSAPLPLLASLLYLLTAIATLRTKVRRFSFSASMVSLSLLLALLSCREPWAVIALLAAATVPPFLELRTRRKSTGVYVFHMTLFVLLLVIGWAFVQREGNTASHSWWALAPLLGAIVIRGGMVPLHCWMTDLFEHATFGTALLTATPLAGAYAALRLVFPVAPDSVLQSLGLLSLATAVYAAGMAQVQRDARRFFCYLFISHSALVFAGLESVTTIGLTGALCLWVSVSLSLAGLGLTLRALEARRGRLSLAHFHGGYEQTPGLAVCFLLAGLASVGFPGTFGFVGTELLVDGAVSAYPQVGMAVLLVAALNGIAILRAYFLLFTGVRYNASVSLKTGPRERVAILTLAAIILGGGLFPQSGVASRYRAATQILNQRGGPTSSAKVPDRPPQLAH